MPVPLELKLRPPLKSAPQHVKCAPRFRRNGGCNAKACFRFAGKHSLVLCGDFGGAGRGSWRGAAEGAKCLRRLPTGSPLYPKRMRVATRLPTIVPGSLFLLSSLWGLWAVRRCRLLERVYGNGMGALASVARRCPGVGCTRRLVWIGPGVTQVAQRRSAAFRLGP